LVGCLQEFSNTRINSIDRNRSIEFDWVRLPNVRLTTPGSNEKTSKPNICDIKTCIFNQLRSICFRWYKLIFFGKLSPPYCLYIEKHSHTPFIVLIITRIKNGANTEFRYYERLCPSKGPDARCNIAHNLKDSPCVHPGNCCAQRCVQLL